MTDERRSRIRYGIVQNPGATEDEVRAMVGEPAVSNRTRDALKAMIADGEIVASKGVIGYSRIGLPIKGMQYYPTALATERTLLDFVVANPGCDEDMVNAYLAPQGGIPNWAETDIGSLESAGMIEVGESSASIGGTNAIRVVRTFSPTTKGVKASVGGVWE